MNPRPISLLLALAAALPASAAAQSEVPMPPGALRIALSRLGTTARVLYVAAHPDDENTRLLAYLANHRHLDVGYLSLTRGGGGQNLIGPEQGALLAAIRTQELLAARRIDGARQFFTRARDFGYSKTPEEALAKWGEDEILADVVGVIRGFRPDVIITRFTEAGPSHGHHTASARLARAAFTAAADPSRFTEQLSRGLTPWPAHRLLLNVPRWGRSKDDVSGYLALDVGGYDPRLGAGYGEVAAVSRTMHKSQGFGSAGRRGPIFEYLSPLAGPAPKEDPLEGVVLDWSRFEGGEAVQAGLRKAEAAFDVEAPERIVPGLLEARDTLEKIAQRRPLPRVTERLEDLDRVLAAALGLSIRAHAPRPEVAPGGVVPVTLDVLLQRPAALRLVTVRWPGGDETAGAALSPHGPWQAKREVSVPPDAPPSVAHWLGDGASAATYAVPDPTRVSDPEDPPALAARLTFETAGRRWSQLVPVVHTWTDRVQGERRRRVQVVPPLTATPAQNVALFPGGATRRVTVRVRGGRAGVEGAVALDLPRGWRSTPKSAPVKLASIGAVADLHFEVRPPSASAPVATARVRVTVGSEAAPALRYDLVDHAHIPMQGILRPSTIRLAPLDFAPPKARIGYLPGSGDTVAEHLVAAGVDVTLLDDEAVRTGRLDGVDVLVLGIRAFNTKGELLAAAHPGLMTWVEAGGRLVVQYNTSNRWRPLTGAIGPFPLTLDRGRVTDETAPLKALDPKHPVLRAPHRLGAADFEGWVQERGLYFANTWDDRYTPIFAAHDPGESDLKGSLLVARHGKGTFVYTGLSFFRQLPAGVPGAYRLLANILSLGAETR